MTAAEICLQHVSQRVPVTALAFFGDDVILIGRGNIVQAYNIKTGVCLRTLPVFVDQSIHGILVDETGVAFVWGGSWIRSILVLNGETGLDLKLGSPPRQSDDWILDAAIEPRTVVGSDARVAGVTAHNALIVFYQTDLHNTNGSSLPFQPVVPGSNSILYSAHVTWQRETQCLIAAGTAFGDVIVWSCTVTRSRDSSPSFQIHYTFSAHEGSVFGVQISSVPGSRSSNDRGRFLATCSDDRTVKIWEITDLATHNAQSSDSQRDTGFGSHRDIEDHAPILLSKSMGHVSRIWSVRFVHINQRQDQSLSQVHHQTSFPYVISFGEDGSHIIWELCPSPSSLTTTSFEMKQISQTALHSGKHIWSTALSKAHLLATGGADGAITIGTCKGEGRRINEIDRALINSDGAQDGYKAYGFVTESTLISTTEKGAIVSMTIAQDDPLTCQQISAPFEGLRNYSLVSTVEGVAFVTGINGNIWMYRHQSESLVELMILNAKPAGIFSCTTSGRIHLVVTLVSSSTATLVSFRKDQPGEFTRSEFVLHPGFVVTSLTVIELSEGTRLILGSRNGSIAVIDPSKQPQDAKNRPLHLTQAAHGKDAVTDLQWVCASDGAGNPKGFLHSTGRDGTHAVRRLTFAADSVDVELVHQSALPFGPNVEGLSFTDDDHHLWIWGFRSKHFVVYDTTVQKTIMSVECGGAHRNWSFRMLPRGGGGIFVWTKASRVFWTAQSEQSHILLESGGHGREIKAVAVSDTSPQIVATGAEDTDIKLFSQNSSGGFQCLQTLRKHNTGIQHMQWLSGKPGSNAPLTLFSSGGFEEFFIWRITPQIPGMGAGVTCLSSHPISGTSDLRILGFEARQSDVISSASPTVEPTSLQPAVYIIAMAYSDSTLKEWRFDEQSQTWTLLSIGDYMTSCLTNVFSLPAPSLTITTSSDGHIATWPAPALLNSASPDHPKWSWTTRHRIHQSSILSTTQTLLADGSTLIATGGDDNAIGLTRVTPVTKVHSSATTAAAAVMTTTTTTTLTPPDDGVQVKMHSLVITRAHAAAVTGLTFAPPRQQSESAGEGEATTAGLWLVSAGGDQRIKVWKIDVDFGTDSADGRGGMEGVSVRMLQDVATAVADVSGLEVVSVKDEADNEGGGRDIGVVVCGVGMDVWRVREV